MLLGLIHHHHLVTSYSLLIQIQQYSTYIGLMIHAKIIIADRTTFDTSMVPSTDALYFHWKRTCWVLDMWGQANRNTMVLKPITENGWTIENTKLCVVWDTEENMQLVRERVNLLLRGCNCVTECKNRVCGCKRKNFNCT